LPQAHRPGRAIPQPRRLSEARRGTPGVPAGADRPKGGLCGQSTPTRTRRSSSMTYFDGFVAPVPKANKDAYLKFNKAMAPFLQEAGVGRFVEAWASDVPDGKLTDFRKSVDAKDDEDVVFAFFEYDSKETRDAATE